MRLFSVWVISLWLNIVLFILFFFLAVIFILVFMLLIHRAMMLLNEYPAFLIRIALIDGLNLHYIRMEHFLILLKFRHTHVLVSTLLQHLADQRHFVVLLSCMDVSFESCIGVIQDISLLNNRLPHFVYYFIFILRVLCDLMLLLDFQINSKNLLLEQLQILL